MRGQSGGKVKKIRGLSENFLVVRRTYPSAFGSPGIGGPYSSAFKKCWDRSFSIREWRDLSQRF